MKPHLARLRVSSPFDLARTAAPVWWSGGRWPSVHWNAGTLRWVGWEEGSVVWRSVRQEDARTLHVEGMGSADRAADWVARTLGTLARMPAFGDPILADLAVRHRGLRCWSAGSLYEGAISS